MRSEDFPTGGGAWRSLIEDSARICGCDFCRWRFQTSEAKFMVPKGSIRNGAFTILLSWNQLSILTPVVSKVTKTVTFIMWLTVRCDISPLKVCIRGLQTTLMSINLTVRFEFWQNNYSDENIYLFSWLNLIICVKITRYQIMGH